MSDTLRDAVDVIITPATAQSHYPDAKAPRDDRQPVSWDALESLPDAFLAPILAVAQRSRVWVYLLPGEAVGVEVLNAPLRRSHKALSVPAENRA